jgi:hypothetical protein
MATTPPPQNNSTDPQVPGNYPGTFQNPTQLPAPVNPASDPEVPPLPNDVDPNFIPNPAPVDNTIDPEVPQPPDNLTTKKRLDPEPVSPTVDPEVSQPTVEQNLFVDAPATVSPAANPEVPQPQPVQNFFTDATPAPVENYFTDETPIVQNYFTDATPVSPTSNPQVPETPIVQNYFVDEPPIVQNYFTDETPIVQNFFTDDIPVNPGVNPQVPNIFSSIGALLSGLFGIRPTPVSPAVNPQVARAILVPTPVVLTPRPIPPVSNPQVAQPPIVQNFFTDATPAPVQNFFTDAIPTPIVQNFFTDATPVSSASNPQVPEPPIVQNFFTDATPAPVENFFTDETPIVQNFFTDATPVSPASNPQVVQPPIVQNFFTDATPAPVENFFTDAAPAPIVQNFFTDATPVSPTSNPEVPQPTQDFGGRKKADPDIVDPVVNPEVPQPAAPAPTFVPQKEFVDSAGGAAIGIRSIPTKIDGPVDQATFQQANPPAASAYDSYVVDTQNKIVEQQTKELEATQGFPVSENQIAVINGQAFGTATIAANVKFKDDIEAARAAPAVPVDTPPPTVAAPAVSPDSNAQVPNTPTKVVAVSTETLLQNDPETAREYTAFKAETAAQLTTQRIAEQEAANGGSISVSEQVQIAARANIDATADANFRYQDQIEAAGAATVVPVDTPPPTLTPAAVVNNPQVVVPPTKVVAVSTETLLQNDPETAQEYTAFKNETAQQLTAQRIAEREAVEGGEISVSEQVQIAARAEIDATADANFRYQDQIQAAGAGTVVPADTPPPTVTAPAVTDTNQPEVQSQNSSVVSSVSQSTLAQQDPATYKAYQTDLKLNEDFLTQKKTAEAAAVYGGEQNLTVDQLNEIRAEASIEAKATVDNLYKNEIEAAGAGTVTVSGTPPPTVTALPVDSAVNQQVPPAQTGEALIDPDNGEVLGYVDTVTGEITDAPPAVSAAANPQVPTAANTTIVSVSQPQLAQTDSALYNDYNSAVATNTAATEEQLTAQALATYGVTTPSDLPLDVQLDIREQALTTGVTEANTLFKDQLEASGAATTQPTGTPPPTVVAVPPSPTPYERFLAEEAAATTQAEAEATARFNAQFDNNGDIIGSSDDPQAFPVDDGAAIPGTELEPVADDNSGYADFFGTDADFNIGEFQAEPELVADDNSGFVDFFGADAAAAAEADIGEFQAEPVADDNSGYADFFGTDADFDVGEFQAEPQAVDPDVDPDANDPLGDFIGDLQSQPDAGTGESAGFGNFFGDIAAGAGGLVKSFAGAISGATDPQANSAQQFALDSISGLVKSAIKTPNQLAAERQAAAKAQAQAQAQVNAQRKQANEGDWRVRLRLAGGADYLYKAKGANGQSAAGILQPLAVTDGVIFPYTPQITTQYQAKYNPYELTHSNYKGYFYQGSSVNEISITAQFTAQDTSEANYLLAVIHFFRSVTKMFYGQDDASKRGAPPPLVFLQGLGEYQFNLHPCVVSSFNYVLPADVDYIRANSVNFDGTNLLQRRDRQNLPIDYVNSASSRLSNAGLTKGGLNTPPPPPTLGTKNPTYVPTKMEIQLILLPMQTRNQVSQQFSLKQFASGDLIRGGFW